MFSWVHIILFVLVFIVVLIIIYAFFILSKLNGQISSLEEENERREDYIRELEVENEKTIAILRRMDDSIKNNIRN